MICTYPRIVNIGLKKYLKQIANLFCIVLKQIANLFYIGIG